MSLKTKIISGLFMFVIAITLISTPTYAKMSSSPTLPVNIMTDTWSIPVETYQGRYQITNTISNLQDASKVVAFYIGGQDVSSILVTVTDINNETYLFDSSDFEIFPSILKNTLNQSFPLSVIYTEVVPVNVKISVESTPNLVSSGGNAITWRTNIQQTAYLSVSSLYSLNPLFLDLLDKEYQKGYEQAREYYGMYLDGLFWGYDFNADWYGANDMFDFARDTFTELGKIEGEQNANNTNLALLSFIPSIIGAIGSFFLTIASFEFLGVSILGVLIVMASIGFVLIALKFIRG